MLIVAITLTLAIALIGLVQIIGVRHYTHWLRSCRCVREELTDFPRVAVILSLRGADPFLEECLERLSMQDYPDFEIHVVVDHPTDPAREVVERWATAHADCLLKLSFLEERSTQAYLKTSAVRQGVLSLDETISVVVLADADTLAYRHWLKDMVVPLLGNDVGDDRGDDVGVVTGNRWYDPNVSGWGSLVRYLYNAACVVPMYLMRATWGGSLSLRREVFGMEYFANRMLDTPCEDAAIQDAARLAGLRLELQPNAMILNRETCGLASCFGFVRRQLTWTRLYHRNWWQVVTGTVAVYLIFTAAFFGAVVAAIGGEWRVAVLLAGAMLVELLVSQWSLESLHAAIAGHVEGVQDETFAPIAGLTRLRMLVALPLALVLISWAVVSATFCRRIGWRGIDYEIVPPDSIRMARYQPYAEVLHGEHQGVSLN